MPPTGSPTPIRVLLARVLRGQWERAEVGAWLKDSYLAARRDPRIGYVNDVVIDQCPTDAARNGLALYALRAGYDVLFSVDHDNAPHGDFFTSGIDYLIRHPAAVVAAPYCGARASQPGYPDREVQVTLKDVESPDGRRRVSRKEAATLSGFLPAYGVGTVLAIGLRVFDTLPPPWWAYRYFDAHHTQCGTEDFTFSEKVVNHGGEVVVNWSCWCGHHKGEMVGKPGEGDL